MRQLCYALRAACTVVLLCFLCGLYSVEADYYSHVILECVGPGYVPEKLEIGCQPQVAKVAAPLAQTEDVVFVPIDTSCKLQETENLFFSSRPEIKNKLVVTQLSNCSSTWEDYERYYFGVLAYLSLYGPSGVILAESIRGKLPPVSVLPEESPEFSPACITTAEKYEEILGFVDSHHKDGHNKVVANTSSMLFPLEMPKSSSNLGFNLASVTIDNTLEIPAGIFAFSPESENITAPVTWVSLKEECLKTDFEECKKCWSKNVADMFETPNDLKGEIALLRPPKVDVQFCFDSYLAFPTLLQPLGVKAVLLLQDQVDFLVGMSKFTSTQLTIPSFTLGVLLSALYDMQERYPHVKSIRRMKLPGLVEDHKGPNRNSETVLAPTVSYDSGGQYRESRATFSYDPEDSNSKPLSLYDLRYLKQDFNVWSVDSLLDADSNEKVDEMGNCEAVQFGRSALGNTTGLEPPTILSGDKSFGIRIAKLEPIPECSNMDNCEKCLGRYPFKEIEDVHLLGNDVALLLQEIDFPCLANHTRLDYAVALNEFRGATIRALVVVPRLGTNYASDVLTMYPILDVQTHCAMKMLNFLSKNSTKVFISKWVWYERVIPLMDSYKRWLNSDDQMDIGTELKKEVYKNTSVVEILQPRIEELASRPKRQDVLVAGRALLNATFANTCVGEVVYVEPSLNCSLRNCNFCDIKTGAFKDKDLDLEGKIAFFPFTISRKQRKWLHNYHGGCLRPVFSIVKLLQDKGAIGVIIGNFYMHVLIYEQAGWHPHIKIPVYNISKKAAWYLYDLLHGFDYTQRPQKVKLPKSHPYRSGTSLVVRMSPTLRDFYEVSQGVGNGVLSSKPALSGRLHNLYIKDEVNRSNSKTQINVTHPNPLYTNKNIQKQWGIKRSRRNEFAYRVEVLSIGVAFFGAVFVGLLINFYKRLCRRRQDEQVPTFDLFGRRVVTITSVNNTTLTETLTETVTFDDEF